MHVGLVGLSRGWSVGSPSICPHYISKNATIDLYTLFFQFTNDVVIYEDFGMNQASSRGTHGYELECMRLSSIFGFITKAKEGQSARADSCSNHLFFFSSKSPL